MLRVLCKSKLHGATVTEANLRYTGSVTIDADLMRAADLVPYERVQIVNLHNGSRVETYCIEGEPGSGTICMNGGAARWAQVGDRLILISYATLDEREVIGWRPKALFLDERNRIKPTASDVHSHLSA